MVDAGPDSSKSRPSPFVSHRHNDPMSTRMFTYPQLTASPLPAHVFTKHVRSYTELYQVQQSLPIDI